MGINAISSSVRASIASELVAALAQRSQSLQARSVSSRKTGSLASDSAFVLGKSRKGSTNGSYAALGNLLMSAGSKAADVPKIESPEEKQRAEQLKFAALKLKSGDAKGARAAVGKLLERNSSDTSALRLVGQSHLAEREYKKAEGLFARAAAIDPGNAQLQGDLSDARALKKSDREVLAYARKRLDSPAERKDVQRLLLRLSDRSPGNIEVYFALADSYDAGRSPRQVIGALQEAVKYADGDQIDGVVTRARKLVNENPQVGLAHNILGRALQKAGRTGEAITELKAASTVAPDNFAYKSDLAAGYVARALSKLARGNAGSAKVDIDAARSIDPANDALPEASARVAEQRARDDINAGRYATVLAKLYTASSKAPDDAKFKKEVAALYSRVGVHFETDGGNAQALSSYIKAYELDPTSSAARRKVGELSHSQGLDALNRKDYDNAVAHLDRAYSTYRPDDTYGKDLARAYDERGQFREALGNPTDALDDYKAGYTIDPTNTSLATNLSNALIQSAAS